MIRILPPEILIQRSRYLRLVREFFFERGYLEVESPLKNPAGGVEPFLDPLKIERSGIQKSPQARTPAENEYLITSPEYNLKILLAHAWRDAASQGRKNKAEFPGVFQIAHCFREGDVGDIHSEEFLMLEWYKIGADEFELMDECQDLLAYLQDKLPGAKKSPSARSSRSVREILRLYCECGLERGELEEALVRYNLLGQSEKLSALRYDELFFTLFLNRIEDKLGRQGPEFIYHYPAELAALSVIQDNLARRFELYWQGIELANGYFELTDVQEQSNRFTTENQLRTKLGKEVMRPDPGLLEALELGLPACSGIALGLDRLLMVLTGKSKLEQVSPFF